MRNENQELAHNGRRVLPGRGWFVSVTVFLIIATLLSGRDFTMPFAKWSTAKILVLGQVGCLLFFVELIRLSKEIQERMVFTICAMQFVISILAELLQPSPASVKQIRLGQFTLGVVAILISLARHPSGKLRKFSGES
jgi:hypothetical protein